ncbi:MAG: endonuclease/exonuclease/phosphatase family protein [Actinomycetota bacterium]
MRCRVVVYNLKGFRLGREPIAEVLHDLAPDVLLVQESGPRRYLRRLGERLGMEVASDPWSPLRRRVKNAVLVRTPLTIAGHRLDRFPGTERFYPRGALLADVRAWSVRLRVVSAHLGLVPAERAAHAEMLADLALPLDPPTILGADLNERPGRGAAARLAEALRDVRPQDPLPADTGHDQGATFPSDDPSARIDYLLVSEGVGVASARVAVEAGIASDHLPLVADLEIG